MIRISILILLLNVSMNALSEEPGGSVCLGKNLSIVASDHSDRLYITVGDSPRIYFDRASDGPKLVVQHLDLDKSHVIKVHFDGEVVESWKLNFATLATDTVLVWRAKGSWRMEPIRLEQCE